MGDKLLSTRQLLDKIPNFPGLYRHSVSGKYYGIKKINGQRREHSLDTTDRKLAERRLKDWISGLEKVDSESSKTSLSALLGKFSSINDGKALKTKQTNNSIVKIFKETWKPGLDIRVQDVKPSQLSEWLGQHEGRLKNSSFNRYALFLKQLFEIAVADRMIAQSPLEGVKTTWKRPQKPIRRIPTTQQVEAILATVRAQRFSAEAKDSGDFLEFLGSAGVGQAEAGDMELGDIDWEKNRIRFRRRKTQQIFYVPIYHHLRPLLEKICQQFPAGTPPDQKVFKVKDAKKALSAACAKLGYHSFSQRNFRQALIVRLLKSGVNPKSIAKWQGHQDGGKLVIDTYTEVISDDDGYFEQGENR